jgi:Tol biopolymer transport system component
MPIKFRTLLPIFALLALTLACSLPSTPDPSDSVATHVAQTLEAMEEEEDVSSPIPDTLEPTEVPETAVPPTPTPTPVPLHIAYVKDGNVWLWTEGSSPTSLTNTGDAEDLKISDDGQVIAFARQVDNTHEELWAVNSDGTNLRNLINAADFDAMTTDPDALTTNPAEFDWVPGTHTLAFNIHPVYMGPGYFIYNDLRLVDADTAAQTLLLPEGQGGRFHYAPDGSKPAVVTSEQISILNADGTNRHEVLTFPIVLTFSEYIFYPHPVWMPDGSALRVVIPPHDSLADPRPPSAVWHIPADGSTPTKLLDVVTIPFFVDVPALSPDAQKIAFLQAVTPGDDSVQELHLANADGSGDTIYDTGNLRFEAWSPTGDHFIYSQNGENPKVGHLGTAPVPIGGISLIRDVMWIRDNEYLYLNRESGSWELWFGTLDAPNALLDSSTSNLISYDFTP